MSVKASCVCADNADSLCITSSNAATAKNALAVISDHMGSGIVKLELGVYAFESLFISNAVILAELLKFAVTASYAGEASFVMS